MRFHHTQIKALAAIGFEATETGAIRTEDGYAITGTDARDTIAQARSAPAPEPRSPYRMHISKARRATYDEHDSNGDAIAKAMREAITRTGDKAKDTHADMATMQAIATANGMRMPQGRNTGHTRMILGNMVRGMWRRGYDVTIGQQVIPAEAQARANRAAKDAARASRAG